MSHSSDEGSDLGRVLYSCCGLDTAAHIDRPRAHAAHASPTLSDRARGKDQRQGKLGRDKRPVECGSGAATAAFHERIEQKAFGGAMTPAYCSKSTPGPTSRP